MKVIIYKTIVVTALALTIGACGEGLIDSSNDVSDADEVASTLTGSQRRQRSLLIKQAAHEKGFYNPVLLAGIAMAETHMAHCWSEATWACKGPASSSCGGGPVIAGSGDGPCAIQEGGLGYFQFDSGTYNQTLATYGRDVLTVEGNTRHAVDYMIKRVIWSDYIPNVETRAQALKWINAVRPNNDKWPVWIKTVTHYYNGCIPGKCSVYTQRYNKYSSNTLNIYNELGHGFWYDATPTEPVEPTDPVIDQGAMDLPWTCDASYRVTQGHNTTFSHNGKGAWAWDFGINVGEPLLAVKDGVVRMAKSTSTTHGCSSAFANDANYVVLDFGDGTEALYLHLQAGSVTVKDGDPVKRGQVLGKVGLSGWVCGAHLHFQIQNTCNSWWCQSVPASFKTIGDPSFDQTVKSDNCGQSTEPVEPTELTTPKGLFPQSGKINNGQSIGLGWEAVAGAQSYDVLMRYQDQGQWKTYHQWDNWQATNMDVHPQFEDSSYQWQVRACSADGCSEWSSAASLTMGNPQTDSPAFTSPEEGEHVRTSHVPVQWRTVQGASSYKVRLEVKNGQSWGHYFTWTRTNPELTIWPVTRNTHYRVSLQSCQGNQCSQWSTPTTFYFGSFDV